MSVSAPSWTRWVQLGCLGCACPCVRLSPVAGRFHWHRQKHFHQKMGLFPPALFSTENTSLILLVFYQLGLSVHWWVWSCLSPLVLDTDVLRIHLCFGAAGSAASGGFLLLWCCSLSVCETKLFSGHHSWGSSPRTPLLKMFAPTSGWSHAPCRDRKSVV